jgi:threonine dehydratase
MDEPTFDDVLRAREVLSEHLPRTASFTYPELNDALGCELWIKHENHQPVGAFKVRGGVNLISALPEEERRRGVITATRGNHGLSIAYAARTFGARAVIVVPHGNNPEKNRAIRAWGAELVERGRDFDEAREHTEEIVAAQGLRYIHSANEPRLIAGVATAALELFEDAPPLAALFVPVGLGSGICGAGLVRDAVSAETRLVGVQAERADSIYRSWREQRLVTTPSSDTFADGLATRVPAELTLGMIRRLVQDFVTVSEGEMARAIRELLAYTHNLAEGAGAAPLAAIRSRSEELRGARVGMVLSGGNLDTATLERVLAGDLEGQRG